MATSRHVILMVLATLVVLFVGSADAGGSHCPYGYKNCDKRKHDCETCILNDVKNCGDCGNVCKEKPYATVKCEDKKCVYKYKCDADTHKDVNNCGWCGNKCKDIPYYTAKCENKKCVYKCKADTKNDVYNCGKCGNKCKVYWKDGAVKCKDGQCKQYCKDGYKYDDHKKCCVPYKKY